MREEYFSSVHFLCFSRIQNEVLWLQSVAIKEYFGEVKIEMADLKIFSCPNG